MKTIAAIVATGQSALAFAQVGPVDIGTGISWPVVGVIALVGLAALGLIYWHRKNPTAETVALAQAHDDMAALAQKAHEALAALIAKLESAKTAPGATPTASDGSTPQESHYNVPVAHPGPSPEQLAAIATARKAYDDALAAAGVPPGGTLPG